MHQNSVLNVKIGNVPLFQDGTQTYASENLEMYTRSATFVRIVARKSTMPMDRLCDLSIVEAAPSMDSLAALISSINVGRRRRRLA